MRLPSAARCENIWFDVATKAGRGADESWDLVHLVNHLGSDRIMFGSDLPYYDFRLVQAQIEAARLDDETTGTDRPIRMQCDWSSNSEKIGCQR